MKQKERIIQQPSKKKTIQKQQQPKQNNIPRENQYFQVVCYIIHNDNNVIFLMQDTYNIPSLYRFFQDNGSSLQHKKKQKLTQTSTNNPQIPTT